MKKFNILVLLCFISLLTNAQLKTGNWAYSAAAPIVLNSNNIAVPVNYSDNNVITIKGMYNATPDAYVSIFSLSQEAEQESEANRLINEKIAAVRAGLKEIDPTITLDIDIISFVPIYDKVLEKKVFGKNTFTETPVGFELKKNIIIEFKKSSDMNKIFSLCTSTGIYDYILTDAVVGDMGKVKEALRDKADERIYKQLERYAKLRDIDIKQYNRFISEGYAVVYPGEKYEKYTAFSCTSYFTQKFNLNNDANKKVTRHYLPVIDKEFDFVVNPIISEPAIQIMYQINLVLSKKPAPPREHKPALAKPQKEVFIITPNGDLRQINL
ncbi:SIMPL domain-containing protein [Bacteroidia bacterium]|nr:SIMPL domain-containing protein [Bacteroidia bacterium]MDB9881540.1 SIMPL domain-containing protein [Bacteroidia bacterium]MDC1395292.1 SIMPL domain-containing protein [Bacteroidia bacterium]